MTGYEPEVIITGARVDGSNGLPAVYVEWVPVGGGVRVVNVDGKLEDRVSPSSSHYHVRMISPDRSAPDQLRTVESYEEACELAQKYARNLDEHAQRVADLVHDLEV